MIDNGQKVWYNSPILIKNGRREWENEENGKTRKFINRPISNVGGNSDSRRYASNLTGWQVHLKRENISEDSRGLVDKEGHPRINTNYKKGEAI